MSDETPCERCGEAVEREKRIVCNGRTWGIFCVECHDVLAEVALGDD